MAHTQHAIFGAGCFWGVEYSFRRIDGVVDAETGYAGGTTENPSYEDVCTHTTGHAEVVRVEYDPERVAFDDLLHAFWRMHDPTRRAQQDGDTGQYRSVIFTTTDEQLVLAKASKEAEDASGRHGEPIVTQIAPAPTFYRAEERHQRYAEKHGSGVCPPNR